MLSEITLKDVEISTVRLNPCCNGICSRSTISRSSMEEQLIVLILVVMEYALGGLCPY